MSFFIQSRFGNRGNFEIVLPRTGGGLVHFWRNNDAPANPWPWGGTDTGHFDYRRVFECIAYPKQLQGGGKRTRQPRGDRASAE